MPHFPFGRLLVAGLELDQLNFPSGIEHTHDPRFGPSPHRPPLWCSVQCPRGLLWRPERAPAPSDPPAAVGPLRTTSSPCARVQPSFLRRSRLVLASTFGRRRCRRRPSRGARPPISAPRAPAT